MKNFKENDLKQRKKERRRNKSRFIVRKDRNKRIRHNDDGILVYFIRSHIAMVFKMYEVKSRWKKEDERIKHKMQQINTSFWNEFTKNWNKIKTKKKMKKNSWLQQRTGTNVNKSVEKPVDVKGQKTMKEKYKRFCPFFFILLFHC